MLTCYSHEVRLPQIDLVYIAFRLAVLDTLSQMELFGSLDDGPDGPFGYLVEVPFLEQVAPAVQVDLLADVWRRHWDTALHEASLLDAAVIYAGFQTAGRLCSDEPELTRLWLKAGPRLVRYQAGSRTTKKLYELFFAFWDDIDFLSIDELQDLEPNHAQRVRELMRLPEGAFEQMEEVLTRWRASSNVLANLEGLLTTDEIGGYSALLTRASETS